MSEMHDQSDAQLLRDYARGMEAAFAEIVSRHTDLVYSAALRQVYSPDLASDVAQSVFADLARKARDLSGRLPREASLVGWLYRATRFAARDLHRGETRRNKRERQAMEQFHSDSGTGVPPVWSEIAPHLEAAMSELEETDRDAVLLRYFKNHDLRTVGATLGITDDAAQKRVSRAVDRLREFFAKRGIAIGASGLAVALSANAVQAAPVGLVLSISAAAALTGTTLATATTATATKAISMTVIQKTIVGVTLVAAVGTGVYEARQASTYRAQVQTLQQQQTPLTEQIQQLQQERDDATSRVAQLNSEVERLSQNSSEVIRLRGEVARLRGSSATRSAQPADRSGASANQGSTGNVSQLTQEAIQLWQSGRLAEAISKFESVLKLDPNNSSAWNGLGWANLNSGKQTEAEQAFQKVVEMEPDHAAALNGLGQLYLSQKKYAEAEPYLLKASPTASAAWFGLTRLYLLQNKFEEAEKWAQAIDDSGQGNEFSKAMLKAAKDKQVSNALRLGLEPK